MEIRRKATVIHFHIETMPRRFVYQAGPPKTISFRLDDDAIRALCERAKVMELSPHELARLYTQELLRQGEERSALRESVQEMNGSLQRLRANLMLSVRAMLTSAGGIDEKEADEWVQKVFREG
jgi:hypothetical protein